MNESAARQVLLVRAVETEPAGEAPALWKPEDAAWASAEARRCVGEHADAERFLAARAELAVQRLGERDAGWRRDPLRPGRGVFALLLIVSGLALAAAIVGNVLGPDRRINLLAPPVWGLLAWNLLVYVALLVGTLRERLRRGRARAPAEPARPSGANALVQRVSTLAARFGCAGAAGVRRRHLADWARASAPLQGKRIAAALHGAAALLAFGVVCSMYLAGLAFDYRAGWDSTWLEPAQVERALRTVFGPIAVLVGIDLPNADALARLRWAEGSAGERAARWIHLYAISLVVVVIVPRLLLATLAALGARRASRRFALPLDEPYFRQLLRSGPRVRWPVSVLPYSYRLGGAQQAALGTALEAALGDGAEPRLVPSLPLGAEDELARHLPIELTDKVALLFAATATPERETHGAFVQAVAAQRPQASLIVLVDESGLRRQFGAAADASPRLQQRREAWQRLLQALSLPMPHFIDLDARPTGDRPRP